jgi:hypothetical protein
VFWWQQPVFGRAFDVPGDALQAVVIDKLPFPPPNDPVVEARGQRLEAQGRSSFNDYFLPEAAVSLKQGAGRIDSPRKRPRRFGGVRQPFGQYRSVMVGDC